MRVLVTGPTGFLGDALLAQLGRHDVACVGRIRPEGLPVGVTWISGDLLALDGEAYQAIGQFAPECCVHLAWAGLPDYSLNKCQDNLRAGAQWIQYLRDIGCRRIIGAGSCWEYGAPKGPVEESSPGVQVNLFAAHKNALREIGQSLLQGSDCELVWARIFFVYGLRQRPTSLIPTAIRAMKQGDAPRIATPDVINDFVHVQDVASALRCLVDQEQASGIYNIGSGRPASVAEVVNAIAVETGHPLPYPRTGHSMAAGFWADIQRMGALGWTPTHTLQSGIAQVVRDWDKIE